MIRLWLGMAGLLAILTGAVWLTVVIVDEAVAAVAADSELAASVGWALAAGLCFAGALYAFGKAFGGRR